MKSRDVELTIVLPAFNEERGIGAVVSGIRESLAGWDGTWEILVVNDASTDRTAEISVAAGARVTCRAENGGYGAAVKTGMQQACGRILALIDADGSYDPADLPRLLSGLRGNDLPSPIATLEFDLVNGVRSREHGRWWILRWLVKGTIRKLAEWVSGRRIPDLNTGFKVFRRDLMLDYLWVLPDGFSCSASMTLALLCDGRAVRFVPVEYCPRSGHSKFRPVQDTANYLATVFRVVMYFRPWRVFLPLTLCCAAAAILNASSSRFRSPFRLADADISLFVLAIAVLGLGLLADLIVAQRRGSQWASRWLSSK